jgi:ParB family transcriptional regulator, chromosome partitioning protein
MSKKKSTKNRKALGRGLSALLPEAEGGRGQGAGDARSIPEVPIDEVKPGIQPRKTFPEKSLLELADSIKRQGVLQPLLVRKTEKGYLLVAGERRWRAAQMAGLEKVPVVIKEASEGEAFELALVENVQRQDLNPIEEAEAYQRLIQEFGHTQEEVARRVGRDRSTVTNELRLLKLPESVRKMVAREELSSGHARALLGLTDAQSMLSLAKKTEEEGWSVRQVERSVRSTKGGGSKKKTSEKKVKSAAVRDLEERLQRSMGTKVMLKDRGKGSGRIEISYNSLDELDRLLDLLLK